MNGRLSLTIVGSASNSNHSFFPTCVYVDRDFNAAFLFGQNVLSRHGSGYKILYRGRDNTSLGLEVDQEGNISIANSDERTGFSARKSWGFKTSGIIKHTGTSLFFEILTKAHAFHNHGILKAYTGECFKRLSC